MRMQNGILSVWQKVPVMACMGFVKSSACAAHASLREFPFSPRESQIFQLAAPLEGYKMRLEWRSSKAFCLRNL